MWIIYVLADPNIDVNVKAEPFALAVAADSGSESSVGKLAKVPQLVQG